MTQEEIISKLHPAIQDLTRKALALANSNLTGRAQVKIAQGLRTWGEQAVLYSQGRTKPGPKVTNAKAGQSVHNYGLAIDIFLLIDGKVASWDEQKDWDGDKQSDWMEVVRAFKTLGFAWGGDWRSFKDMPHFEYTHGLDWQALSKLHDNKTFIAGTEFVILPNQNIA